MLESTTGVPVVGDPEGTFVNLAFAAYVSGS